MINVWEHANAFGEARFFHDLYQVQGTVLVDEAGDVPARLGVRGVPCNVFVDADGTVRAVGATTPAQLWSATTDLLGTDTWQAD